MLALGLLLNIAGIGLLCWLIVALAVNALPFFVGLYVFMIALHSGAGILGAPLVGIAAGGITLAIGQMAFAMTRSVFIRTMIATLFAVPATLAGYQVVFAMTQIGVPSLVWREIFACFGAVFIGGTAWARLAVLPETRPLSSGRALGAILSRLSRQRRIRSDPAPFASSKIGVDRRVEGGVIELERAVVAISSSPIRWR